MTQNKEPAGYFKYSGKSVGRGLFDARSAADALLGFDQVFRYFLGVENPKFRGDDFEIPVRIGEGSWEIQVFDILNHISQTEPGVMVEYFQQIKQIKQIFRFIYEVVRIFKHCKGSLNDNEKTKFVSVDGEIFVKLTNSENEVLTVRKTDYDEYIECRKDMFGKLAELIHSNRTLEIGFSDNEKYYKVSITDEHKRFFCAGEDNSTDKDKILPELKHGDFVKLKGEIISAMEERNSIRFRYEGYNLICIPKSDKIARFKKEIVSRKLTNLFPQAVIKGKVDRSEKDDGVDARKPKINFSEILPIEIEQRQDHLPMDK